MIRAFDIPNETVKPGTFGYGIPYPGLYIIDPNGKIIARGDYKDDVAATDFLGRPFGAQPGEALTVAETVHLRITTVRATASRARYSALRLRWKL